VGTYLIVPTLVDPDNNQTNYTVNLVNGSLTITQAVPPLTWSSPVPIIYGSALSSNQLNATTPVPGSFAYAPTSGTVLNAGPNTLSAIFTPADSMDYQSATDSVSVVIAPAPLIVTAANASRTYGMPTPLFTGVITGLQNGDKISAIYSTSATTNSPAGTYSITPTLVDPDNRQTNYAVSLVSGTLTVVQAAAIIDWTNLSPITYGDALSSNQLNATANVPGGFAYIPTNGIVLNAGTSTLSAIFTPTDPVDYRNVTNTVNLVILQAPLLVTASNATCPYGAAVPEFSGTITGLTNNDNITAAYSCNATNGSPPGIYSIVPSLVGSDARQSNYTVSLVSGTLTVGQGIPIMTWINPSPITYGSALTSNQLNAAANIPGSFAYIPTNGSVLNACTNMLLSVFTPTDGVDYSNVTNTVNLVVSPIPLLVTASNAISSYGAADPEFWGTITGLTNGDNITAVYSCNATIGSPPGTYSIVPSLVDPNNRQTNYTVSFFMGTLTVDQRTPIITWANPSPITYGTDLTSNQLNAKASVAGSFAYIPTNGSVLNAGTNTLLAVFTPTDAVDYSNVTNTVNLVISQAPLLVTASNAISSYGAADPEFWGTIAGLTNGDNITAVYSCNATIGSPPGMYSIVPILVDPNNRQTNYTVTFVIGTLTVSQGLAIMAWTNPAPITYGVALTSNQLNAASNVPGTFAYVPTNGSVLNAGTNTLSVIFTPIDTVDYSTFTNTMNLIVSQAPLTVTSSNANCLYGSANPTFTGAIAGLTNGDNITVSYSCSASTNSSVGTYPITPVLVDPNDRETNYTVSLVNGTLTIMQAAPLVAWTNPAPVICGTALNSNQLNATTTVPGSFAYNPTNGTVLDAGTNTLSVVFTPADIVDYNRVTNSVSLVIDPIPTYLLHLDTSNIGSIGAQLTMSAIPGQVYEIQASTNLVDWVDLNTVDSDPSGVIQFLDAAAKNYPQRFYRVAKQ
jgi:hypothetical protein